jgi:uncharacterized protein with HEPN domain
MYSNLELVRHIKDKVDFVLASVSDKTQNELLDNAILRRAVVRSLEIIGEASKKIEAEFKYEHAHIEWNFWIK